MKLIHAHIIYGEKKETDNQECSRMEKASMSS